MLFINVDETKKGGHRFWLVSSEILLLRGTYPTPGFTQPQNPEHQRRPETSQVGPKMADK